MIGDAGFFVSATVIESLAVMLFNGFAAVFLLPVLLMDLFYFLPAGLFHLLMGKARPRILAASMTGFFVWLLGFGIALGVVRLVDAFALELLYRTWSGLATAAGGAAHSLISVLRYSKNMREYYYANVLEKNLSRKQTEQNDAFRLALQTGELDAVAIQDDRSKSYLARRIARDVVSSRQEVQEWREGIRQDSTVYFL